MIRLELQVLEKNSRRRNALLRHMPFTGIAMDSKSMLLSFSVFIKIMLLPFARTSYWLVYYFIETCNQTCEYQWHAQGWEQTQLSLIKVGSLLGAEHLSAQPLA